jgi:hypothetical protein
MRKVDDWVPSLLSPSAQGGSIITESFRLVLIQILLQSRGIKLNP